MKMGSWLLHGEAQEERWTRTGPGSVNTRRETVLRCECAECGVHFHVETGLVITGGNCPNCGSYRHTPIQVERRGQGSPWTWRTA